MPGTNLPVRAPGNTEENSGTSSMSTVNTSDSVRFPARTLIRKNCLTRWPRLAQPARQLVPEHTMRLVPDPLNLERQGRHHDLPEPGQSLYAAFMRTR